MLEKIRKFFDYIATSLASAVIDLAFFYIFFSEFERLKVYGDTFIATILARIVSSIVAYVLNRKIVFKSEGSRKEELIKHFSIVLIQMILSASLLTFVDSIVAGEELIEKCIIDGLLFFVGYFLQKFWVFKDISH